MKEYLPVLYQDDRIIAVHKPAGLLVHRSDIARAETRFAVQLLRDQLGRKVWPLHRLDRGTSGVLVFALDDEAARTLGLAFQAQRVHKRYLAVVRGHPLPHDTIDYALKPLQDTRLAQGAQAAQAQAAVTRYTRLATVELPYAVDRYPRTRYALLSLTPDTGRRHQLRRHLKHIAHPIIGDATYGKGVHNRFVAEQFGCARLLLACTHMRLPCPDEGPDIVIDAPPSDDFQQLLDAFGWCLDKPADL